MKYLLFSEEPPFLFPPRGKRFVLLLPPWGKVGKGVKKMKNKFDLGPDSQFNFRTSNRLVWLAYNHPYIPGSRFFH